MKTLLILHLNHAIPNEMGGAYCGQDSSIVILLFVLS